jgi:UDPglucose 6-dehydrogenase
VARIGIFGAGYVGLVTGACLADLGHDVVVRDIAADRIGELDAGRLPIYEPGLEELIASNRARLRFTLDVREALEGSDFVFVCVGTPPTPSGDADLSSVWTVVDELPVVRHPTVLVMKSTVPPRTGERIRAALDARGLENVGYVSNPEFTAEGSAVADFMRPDRIVIGAFDPADGDAVERLHEGIDGEIVRTDVTSAEMVKMASNAFLSTRISFINEIANVCELVGADVSDVARGVGLDHRLGPHFLRAGLGFGGSCFPKDVSALKQLAGNEGYHFQLLAAVIEVNELQKRRVVQKLQKYLGSLRGMTIALLGLAFKANTDDMREAPSIVLASRLLAEGASVRGWDPVADARPLIPHLTQCATPLEAVTGADAAVIVTEWAQLKTEDWATLAGAMRRPLLLDGRNFLDPEEARGAGFVYEGIGRGTRVEERVLDEADRAATPDG